MDKKKVYISYKKFNPNFHHLKKALTDDSLRFIFLIGGSSSAKSFSVAQAMLLFCITHGYNTKVYRKTGASISDSIYKTFREASRSIGIGKLFSFKENKIECINGSYITFSGLDDPEKIKGLDSYQFVVCEELSGFDEVDFKQIKKRLRGRPGQKIISMFNPISEEHWIKKNIFDKESLHEISNHLYGELKDSATGKILPKEFSAITKKFINSERKILNPRGKVEIHAPDTLILKSTYLNNFWVVGSPCGTYGFYDRQAVADFDKDRTRDYNYYRIYALGDWGSIKTGGEFLHAFDGGKHRGNFPYTCGLPVHISIDNNVLPYISMSFFQVEGLAIRQIHEICAEDPFNTVTKASEMARLWLEEVGYKDVVFLHGDASTKAGNTIDEEKRSFLDKFIEGLEYSFRVEDCVPSSNPPVALSGEFINSILSSNIYGISIGIDDSCTKSIRDYENVKKDVNGTILKKRVTNKETGQSYEEFGHITDTLRYVCADVFKDEFIRFSLRRKRSTIKEGKMLFYAQGNVSGEKIVYLVHVKGRITAIFCMVNSYVDICDVQYSDNFDETEFMNKMIGFDPVKIVCECGKSQGDLLARIRERFRMWVIPENGDKDGKIEANKELMKSLIRFPGNYESLPGINSFINSVLDYPAAIDISAMYSVCSLANYAYRKYRLPLYK